MNVFDIKYAGMRWTECFTFCFWRWRLKISRISAQPIKHELCAMELQSGSFVVDFTLYCRETKGAL